MILSDVILVEDPPVFQQYEDQSGAQPGTRELQQNDHPPGPGELPDWAKRPAQVLRGMQDVGRDDHIERMQIESLLERIALDIESPILHERILDELVLRAR